MSEPLEKIISPADYHPTADPEVFAVNPTIKENLHCRFVTALKEQADKEGWILRMVPEGTPNSGFPEVCLIYPGQEKEHVLHSFRIDAGIPDEIRGEDLNRSDVDRIIRIALLKQRAFAGPLDVHLPSILASNPIATFTSKGEGAYNPEHWAEVSMKFVKILREESDTFRLFERKIDTKRS
jgi:hypothetical protein